jgi:benzylsuccinate CoA-transferase BbsF subunit
MTSLLADAIVEYTREGREPKANGNMSTEAAPHGVYPCAGSDEWCAIAVFNEEQWAGLKRATGSPDWMNEDRFADLPSRLEHSEELDRLVGDWTRGYPAEEVMAKLQKEGVPAGVVRDARGLVNALNCGGAGFLLENRPS